MQQLNSPEYSSFLPYSFKRFFKRRLKETLGFGLILTSIFIIASLWFFNPSDPVLFFNYGSILKKLDQSKDAEIYLRKSIQLNPNFAEAYANLGNLLSELDQSIEAELLIRKSIKY